MSRRVIVRTSEKPVAKIENQPKKQRRVIKPVGRPRADPREVEETISEKPNKMDYISDGDFERGVISTGSTLLDLAISSNRVHGGGVPAGVIMEVYGPSSSGKTAILADIGASSKSKGGVVKYDDPEARLDTAYAARCGLVLRPDEYNKPDTVEQLETAIFSWQPKPKNPKAICVRCVDSLAAFTTAAEMEDKHKMGAAKRAQNFHKLFRRLGRLIDKNGWIIACSNQEQVNFETGSRTTPTGGAIKYWSSIRIRISQDYQGGRLKRTWKLGGKSTVEKVIGIRSTARITKNSCDDPFREVPIFILFGRGVDDIRGNLQWVKETMGLEEYDCVNKSFKQLEPAIRYIEEHGLEAELREKVIALYNSIEKHFRTERKPKVRF